LQVLDRQIVAVDAKSVSQSLEKMMALPTLHQYIEQHQDSGNIAYQTPILSQDQLNNVNRLVGAAAFDENISRRLLGMRDETLCETYHLSAVTWGYLTKIEADTIEEFCSQVLKLQFKMLSY
jgi:hypothetical protein